jgi:hypothetical protein
MLSVDEHQKRKPPAPPANRIADVVWPAAEATHRVGAPLAWGIALATVATVFAIIAMIANYGPLNSASREALVSTELPASRYDAVSALITAAGERCTKICAIKPEPSLSGATRIDVMCASTTASRSCAAPVRYAIAVSKQD